MCQPLCLLTMYVAGQMLAFKAKHTVKHCCSAAATLLISMCHSTPKWADNPCAVQIPATQPLLVLATCQRSPEQLPPVLLRFFQTQSAVVTSARTTFNSTLCNPTAAGSNTVSIATEQQASRPHGSSSSSSSRVIVVGLEAASSSSWQEAIDRTAEAAANVVASAAASVFQSQLVERIRTGASQTGSTMAGQDWGRARGSSGVAESGQEQGWVRGTSGIEKAMAELQAETHQEGSEPAASGRLAETSGHLPKGWGQLEEVPGQVTAAGANRSAGKGHQAAVNKNDLQKGLKLHAEVSISLSESCWVSIPPSQHHALVSAIVGAAKGVPFCNNHMTALSSSPHQTPFCSKSILAVSSDARGCQHGMHMHHYCMPAIKCCFPSSTLTSTASSRQM